MNNRIVQPAADGGNPRSAQIALAADAPRRTDKGACATPKITRTIVVIAARCGWCDRLLPGGARVTFADGRVYCGPLHARWRLEVMP